MSTPLFKEGVLDAVGFVGGALLGYWLGQWLGLDIFAPGYSPATIVAILLVSLGGGGGLQVARALHAKLQSPKRPS